MKCEFVSRFTLSQKTFNRAKALQNTKMLVAHANAAFKKLYSQKYPKSGNYLPMQVMYRCFILARTLIVFELVALLAPEEMVIDPFELFKTKGGFIFNSYCGPNGASIQSLSRFAGNFTSGSHHWKQYQKPAIQKVSNAWLLFM